MLPHKVFVDEDDKVVLACPQCGNTKRVNLSSLKGYNKKNLKVKCTCSSHFAVSLEYRKYRRKKTNLEGTYEILSKGSKKDLMQVANLSIGGIGFSTRSFGTVSVGDRMKLSFTLDDKKQSEVEKEVVVRHVFGNYVGCEFIDTSQHDSNLAFYLMP